jgi:hypothetical protein
MSPDVFILEKKDCALDLEISANQVGVVVYDYCNSEKATAFFDLREDNDRKKLKEMIMHLQHQLNIHEDR